MRYGSSTVAAAMARGGFVVRTVTSAPSAAKPLARAARRKDAAAGSGRKIRLTMTTLRGLMAFTVS